MLCIGAGAGGGSSGASNTGWGGGGSGAISRLTIPALFIPDRLYVQVGTSGAQNSAGAESFISSQEMSTAVGDLFLVSGAAAAPAVSSTTGGAAETIATSALCKLSTFGIATFIAGVAGANGGNAPSIAGSNAAVLSNIPLSGGGGGGGGGSNSGGNITGAGIYPTILGGSGTGNAGNSGFTIYKPFVSSGGSGGSGGSIISGSGANGGAGGNGGIGCGGGGGGGGNVSGSGGIGGNGFVGIWCS